LKLKKFRYENNKIFLNIEAEKVRQAKIDIEDEKFLEVDDFVSELNYSLTPYDLALIKKDEALDLKRKTWLKKLFKDVYIEEAINTLLDMVKSETQKVAFKIAK
jgi:C-terminal domain of tail specific protease (DUF3340)